MARRPIPDTHKLLRHISPARLPKDADGNVVGIAPAAFALRADEDYLSACNADHYQGSDEQKCAAAVRALRATIKVKAGAGFAVGLTGNIRKAALDAGHRVRIIHEPKSTNPAYAALREWPREADDLFEILAANAWGHLIMNGDVPA